jgi:hypothetical protein
VQRSAVVDPAGIDGHAGVEQPGDADVVASARPHRQQLGVGRPQPRRQVGLGRQASRGVLLVATQDSSEPLGDGVDLGGGPGTLEERRQREVAPPDGGARTT